MMQVLFTKFIAIIQILQVLCGILHLDFGIQYHADHHYGKHHVAGVRVQPKFGPIPSQKRFGTKLRSAICAVLLAVNCSKSSPAGRGTDSLRMKNET